MCVCVCVCVFLYDLLIDFLIYQSIKMLLRH